MTYLCSCHDLDIWQEIYGSHGSAVVEEENISTWSFSDETAADEALRASLGAKEMELTVRLYSAAEHHWRLIYRIRNCRVPQIQRTWHMKVIEGC